MPDYLPYSERAPSSEYRDMLRTIRDSGTRVPTKQGVDALAVAGCSMRFPMAHGAAVITERSIGGFARKAIGELCAFINGARTLDELAAFGCDWWGPVGAEEKSRLARARGRRPRPGLLRARVRALHDALDDEADAASTSSPPDQKLQDLPEDRTALLSPWIPQANHREAGVKSRNTIAPCHGWIHALVFGDKLHLVHNQRSGDTPIGVPSNMVQYNALGLMIEHLTGYELVEYVHWIQYAHIYVNQLEQVDEMLEREPRPLPTLRPHDAGPRSPTSATSAASTSRSSTTTRIRHPRHPRPT
jgi:thymidylate synthase